MKNSKRILSLMLSAVMLLALAPFAVSANAAKPADYANALYFEGFEGDTELDADTTLKYGGSTATVMSGDSALTPETTETGSYLELKSGVVGTDMTFGVEYEAATSPVESKYPASKVAMLAKTQASFDLCPVDIDRQINVYFRESITAPTAKSVTLMYIQTDGKFGFSGTNATYTYTEGAWVSVDFYFDFTKQTYSVYVDDVAVFENATLTATLDQCIESFVFQAGALADGQKYNFYVDNMRIAIPEMYAADIVNYDFEDITADNAASKGLTVTNGNITIEDSGTDRGKVASLTSTASGASLEIQSAATRSFATYQKYGKYPDVVEVEIELKRASSTNVRIHFDSKWLVKWSGDFFLRDIENAVRYSNFTNRPWAGTGEDKPYTNIKLTIDFAARKYSVYVDEDADTENQYQGYVMNGTSIWFDLPSGITSLEKLSVYVESNGATAKIAKMRISAQAPYGTSTITDYLTEEGYKTGYVLNNADAENPINYTIFCAKYNADDTLESVTKAYTRTVPVNTLKFENLDLQTATDGGYYKYYVWQDGTLVPLLEV